MLFFHVIFSILEVNLEIMVKLSQIIAFFIGLFILSSCNVYGVLNEDKMIAQNDVYMQRPSKVNLAEDPNDMTTYNAYRAGRSGVYHSHYNNSMRFGMYDPFYDPFFNPYRYRSSFMFGYNPYGFHGISPYWSNSWGYNSWGFNHWSYNHYGMNAHHWGYNSWGGYGYGYGYNNYGCPTWGGNWSSAPASGGNSGKNVFTGPRQNLTASSRRSSTYSNTTTSINAKSLNTQNGLQGKRGTTEANRSELARSTNMRKVERGEFVKPTRDNTRTLANSSRSANVSRSDNNYRNTSRQVASSNQRNNLNNTYRPSSSAQRSGVVNRSQAQRSTGNNIRGNTANSTTRNRSSYGTTSRDNYSRGTSYGSTRSSGVSRGSSGVSRGPSGGSRGSTASPSRSSSPSMGRSGGGSSRGGSTGGRRR